MESSDDGSRLCARRLCPHAARDREVVVMFTAINLKHPQTPSALFSRIARRSQGAFVMGAPRSLLSWAATGADERSCS